MRVKAAEMEIPQAAVLVVGARRPSLQTADLLIDVVGAATLSAATGKLKRCAFDLVIIQIGVESTHAVNWVERLRTAKPLLPVVACLEPGAARQTVESRLRAAGVNAVVGDDQNLERWLELWWVAWVGRHVNENRKHVRPVGPR